MDAKKVDLYLVTNAKFFPANKIPYIKEKLLSADESKYDLLMATELKNPTTIFLVSLFVGALGIDRFMLGDNGMGILKLLTGGVCGVLAIIDWFTVSGKAKELNYNNLMLMI